MMDFSEDARQYAPAAERNRQPILAVLQRVLPQTGTILEIASGTGQHAAYFAPQLQPRHWFPSDCNPRAFESINAWRIDSGCQTLYSPIFLDVTVTPWLLEEGEHSELNSHPISGIVNINMIHIAPWSACLGLMAGAGRILPRTGILYLYGPFKREGEHTAPSNAAFDQSLRTSNPQWGVRDLEAVIEVAQAEGLQVKEVIEMPANNLSVIFEQRGI